MYKYNPLAAVGLFITVSLKLPTMLEYKGVIDRKGGYATGCLLPSSKWANAYVCFEWRV